MIIKIISYWKINFNLLKYQLTDITRMNMDNCFNFSYV